jgi:putative integral membrane protein (TIGR02587 family)
LAFVSLMIMHAFVYAIEFRGQEAISPATSFWNAFLRFTVVGYTVVLLISVYVLWTFGRTDATAPEGVMMATVVLGFPAAVGAAAARLIL